MTSLAKWYESIVINSGIASPGLVKGTLFIHPKGWRIWEKIQQYLNTEFRSIGIRNVAFPSLIPLTEIEKEKNKLSGFQPELFLVSKTGNLGDPTLFLRPTSEILFCHYFRKVLNSHEQLPLLLNQWCNVYRAEKNTKAFLRTCEFYWQEAHTLHKTKEDALSYLSKFHEIYKKLVKNLLNLAFLEGEKTLNERFQGAENTLSLEAIMPDGQALQIATSHYLSKNFSEIFDVKYSSFENKLENPYQLSAGSSTRLLGALILGHSDSKGLVLPFGVADIQIKILVIEEVVKVGDSVYELINNQLKEYEVSWDFSTSKSFGFRINHEEIMGTPFVFILGNKELSENKVTIKSRISSEKITVNLDQLSSYMCKASEEYSQQLYDRSRGNLESMVVDLREGASLDRVKKEVLENGKIVLVPWFDDEENEETFKSEKFGFGARCIKEKIEDRNDICFYSGKRANSYVYFGRSY